MQIQTNNEGLKENDGPQETVSLTSLDIHVVETLQHILGPVWPICPLNSSMTLYGFE